MHADLPQPKTLREQIPQTIDAAHPRPLVMRKTNTLISAIMPAANARHYQNKYVRLTVCLRGEQARAFINSVGVRARVCVCLRQLCGPKRFFALVAASRMPAIIVCFRAYTANRTSPYLV